MLSCKSKGNVTELKFLLRAAQLGYTVSQPFGDNAKYDFIVDSGKLTRVQVKSTSVIKKCDTPCIGYKITCNFGAQAVAYSVDDFDLLAILVEPLDLWYIIPMSEVAGKRSFSVYPNTQSKYEKFREAWNMFSLSCG